MKKILASAFCFIALHAGFATAANDAPVAISPDSLRWVTPPGMSGIQMAWIVGAEKTPGPYLLRVKLAPGARIIPHTHPDLRSSSVLAGTLYVGFGETFDDSRLVAIPTGSVYVAPAGVAHFILARDGEVLYQESGTGPTATAPLQRP